MGQFVCNGEAIVRYAVVFRVDADEEVIFVLKNVAAFAAKVAFYDGSIQFFCDFFQVGREVQGAFC